MNKTTETTLASDSENVCLSSIVSWANNIAKKDETRTAHIYWPKQVLNSNTISFRLYAALEIYCEDECEITEADTEMYSFHRATHYWGLEKVYNETIKCDLNAVNEESDKVTNQTFETNYARVTSAYNSKGCTLTESPKVRKGSGCITIKAEPK